jgi:hypothetical protein
MKKLILITTLAILPAFATIANTGNLPANYKTVALKAVKATLRDPDSVKTLRLSPNAPFDLADGSTAVVVAVNAKNGFGGYSGVVPVAVYFKNGRVINVLGVDF